jgi:hypothetical protein
MDLLKLILRPIEEENELKSVFRKKTVALHLPQELTEYHQHIKAWGS